MPEELGFNPLRVPFEQAVKNLQDRVPKGLPPESLKKIKDVGPIAARRDTHWNWHDTLAHQHASAFVVARMADADLLRTVHASLVRAQRDGWSFDRWQKSVSPQLKMAGWWGKQEVLNPKTGKMELAQLGSPRRLKTIYRTNMRVAMMAAHYKRMKETADLLPLWRYVAVRDKRTRPTHAALHNTVFPHDHPFWDTHFPPNGWGCRCTVVAESDSSLDDLRTEIEDANKGKAPSAQESLPEVIDATDVPTVTMEEIPSRDAIDPLRPGVDRKTVPVASFRGVRPDPGWSYNPGQMLWARETMLLDRIRELPQGLAKALVDRMARTNYAPWEGLVKATMQTKDTKGTRPTSGTGRKDVFVLRWMPSDLVQALRKALERPGLDPFLAVDQVGVWHPIRPAKNQKLHSGARLLPLPEYLKLPGHLANAQAVYLDLHEPNTIAVASPLGSGLIKTVFRLFEQDGRTTLELVTSGQVGANAFNDPKSWQKVEATLWGRRPQLGKGR